jgi:hypothetical protein
MRLKKIVIPHKEAVSKTEREYIPELARKVHNVAYSDGGRTVDSLIHPRRFLSCRPACSIYMFLNERVEEKKRIKAKIVVVTMLSFSYYSSSGYSIVYCSCTPDPDFLLLLLQCFLELF